MAPDTSPSTPAATPAGQTEKIRQFSSVAEATLALGSKTYSGTIAQGGGGGPATASAR